VKDSFLADFLPFLDLKLFTLGKTEVTVATMATAAGIVLATLATTRILGKWMARIAASRDVQSAGSIAVTERLVHYAILIGGLGLALHTLGIDLTALFAAGALFAIAIGFAMQNIAQNFVSGVILLFERSIKPGDMVEVDGQLMMIKELGIRSTLARGLNEEDLIIPNSLLVQSTVTNYTLRDTLYRIDSKVGVVYASDMHAVKETLQQAAESVPWRSPHREPIILMREFGSSSVDFTVSVWTNDPWDLRKQRSILNEAIWRALKEAGITIAFPQLDVHFDPPVDRALEAIRSTGG
jgi:small-conductance mechanosensitive channel